MQLDSDDEKDEKKSCSGQASNLINIGIMWAPIWVVQTVPYGSPMGWPM